jgi:hypothetical protein
MPVSKLITDIHGACADFNGDFSALEDALDAVLSSNSDPQWQHESKLSSNRCEIVHRFNADDDEDGTMFAFYSDGDRTNTFQICLSIIAKEPSHGSYEAVATVLAFGFVSLYTWRGDGGKAVIGRVAKKTAKCLSIDSVRSVLDFMASSNEWR